MSNGKVMKWFAVALAASLAATSLPMTAMPVFADEVSAEDVHVEPINADEGKIYTVIINGNGATSGSMADITVQDGEKFTAPKNTFKKKGYTFAGWKVQNASRIYKEGEEIALWDWDNDADLDADVTVTLTAQWKNEFYKITYKLKGGTNAGSNPATYTYSERGYKITLADPTRAGFAFQGWYSNSSCKTRVKTINTKKTGNITLYAKWKKDKYASYKDFLKANYAGKNAYFWMGDVNGDGVKELVIADYSGASSYDWQYIICTMKKGVISDKTYESARGTLTYYKSSKCIVCTEDGGGSLSANPGETYKSYNTLSNGKFKWSSSKSLKGTGKKISPKYKVTSKNISKYCK